MIGALYWCEGVDSGADGAGEVVEDHDVAGHERRGESPPGSCLEPCPCHRSIDDQRRGVGQDVALAAGDLLARIITFVAPF